VLLDRVIAWKLERCDVFIGMSSLCVCSARRAREKYGARVFIERGSTHILRQKEIMDHLRQIGMSGGGVADFDVCRELATYELADVITIPSLHVEESFYPYPVQRAKLFRNPYGADLAQFIATNTPDLRQPTLLFAGQWCFRKGCDLLVRVMQELSDVRLMHVGGLGDAPWPQAGNFEHHPAVNEWDLPKYYAQAHVFVLASREEGFAKVLLQAAACGVPVVCTDQTGGLDLQAMVGEANFVKVVPCDDVAAFVAAVRLALDYARSHPGPRVLPTEVRERLSWRSYGKRYADKLAAVGKVI
jgi:glycosyltransferase involved in cell wall biosynthesis